MKRDKLSSPSGSLEHSQDGTGCVCAQAGAFDPVKRRASSSSDNVSTYEEAKSKSKSHTQLEEIHPRIVTSYIEVIFQQPTCFKSELCEIMPSIITEEKES
jgi:hypothetical protein